MGYGWQDFGKRRVFKRIVENAMKMSTTGLESEPDDGEELDDDDAPDCSEFVHQVTSIVIVNQSLNE